MIDWLKEKGTVNEVTSPRDEGLLVYPLGLLREDFEVVDLGNDAYLILKWCKDRFWLDFAVMDRAYETNDGVWLSCLFHGCGPSETLRECRHTWWGEKGEGYLFYANGPAIAAAFKELSKYFDGMAEGTEDE